MILASHDGILPAAALVLWAFGSAVPLHGQAWVPLRGQGDISISYQRIGNEGHRLTDGKLIPHGQSVDVSAFLEADYGLTDRFSITLGIPYVFTKYTDSLGPPPPLPYLPGDVCHCWHASWQDFGITARYNAARSEGGKFSLTPSISAGIPSRDYAFRGESATGRNLEEMTAAIDAGQRLDFLSPNLSLEGRYSYGFVERVLDIPNNRSNVSLEGRYALFHARLTLRGVAAWQRTHGGLRTSPTGLAFPGEVNTQDRLIEHDRLLRDDYFHSGGATSYSFARIDVFASYIVFVSGTDTHAGEVFTAGVSWPFEWRPGRYRKPSAK